MNIPSTVCSNSVTVANNTLVSKSKGFVNTDIEHYLSYYVNFRHIQALTMLRRDVGLFMSCRWRFGFDRSSHPCRPAICATARRRLAPNCFPLFGKGVISRDFTDKCFHASAPLLAIDLRDSLAGFLQIVLVRPLVPNVHAVLRQMLIFPVPLRNHNNSCATLLKYNFLVVIAGKPVCQIIPCLHANTSVVPCRCGHLSQHRCREPAVTRLDTASYFPTPFSYN